ncbi:MAG: cytochrome c oxidase subunit 3 [Paraglaciecola sp.]|jgi:cytochrome c oxidase subunit 3
MSNQPNQPRYDEYSNFAFHPYNILLMLTLAGVCALFLAFSGAYVYNGVQYNLPPVKLPTLFFANTLILLGSSYTMMWAKRSYLDDETQDYKKALVWTMVLSFIFLGMQFVAWSQLFSDDVFVNSNNSASYLYLLSGVHFAHVIAGLPFLGLFLWTAHKRMKEPVSVLIYFSDPEKRLKLRLLTIYWHFLDALWVFLVIFLWVNYLIR